MNKPLFISCLVSVLAIAPMANAENLTDLSVLLSTGSCLNCDLVQGGFFNAKLGRAVLRGSDLRQANLSRADLSLADLRGVDLRGASLVGANLAGADLEGALLDGADLREAYLVGANFKDASINTPYITRAVGLLDYPGSIEQMYRWGFVEAQNKNYQMAITYYDRAISMDPSFAVAHLSRAMARYQLRDFVTAQRDAEIALNLFEQEQSVVGIDVATRLLDEIEVAQNPDKGSDGGGIGTVFSAIASFALRLFF